MQTATVVSIQVGTPQEIEGDDPRQGPWLSGIGKRPVRGAVRVGRLNLEGDGQADTIHHGGCDKAVLAYSADHYPLWRSEEPLLADCPFGGFGENLTVAGLSERTVCIGDRWRADDVVFEVSQPRQPCWKLGRRWRMPELPKRVVQTGRSGWYLRVVEQGTIQAGMPFVLEDRPHGQWTVERVALVFYDRHPDTSDLSLLAALEELSDAWREELAGRM
jgi:MOSC domain-containing protein YiiM